jgi:hypothetical protein
VNVAATFFGMTGPKRKAGKKTGQARKRAKKDDDDWGTESEEGDGEEGGDDDEENDGDEEPRSPIKTRGKPKAVKKPRGGKGGGAKWAETAKLILLDTTGTEMGTDWKEVVDSWWTLEELWKFATSVSLRDGI